MTWLRRLVTLLTCFTGQIVLQLAGMVAAVTAVVAAAPRSPALAQAATDLHQVITQHQQTVVKLFGAGVGNLDSYGSGCLISAEGHVLTIWNHLINTGFLTAVTADGHRYTVDVVATSRDFDVAILKLNADSDTRFPFVPLQDSLKAAPGSAVLAFSNMFHVATGAEPVSVVHGVVAAVVPVEAGLGRWSLPVKSPVYVVDAVINNSGAGGGLLTTRDGRPIGLIGREIQYRETGTWINYAVPLTELRPVVEALLAGNRVDSGSETPDSSLVISDRELTSRFGLTLLPAVVERTPCYVDAVAPGSVAFTAGLRPGDLIVLLDDAVIVSVTDFRRKLSTHRPGQRISLTVQRNRQLTVIPIRVP